MQAPALAFHDVACRRGDRVLFRGLSLTCEAGSAWQVTGPNGSGKTSLIRIAAGLLAPFSGSVKREGNAALLDERHALDPDRPLGEALRFWARLDGSDRFAMAVETAGLTPLLPLPVRDLSTGQKKRAGIARLLLGDASIWLLDEPLNGLDADWARRVEDLMRDHVAGGGIVLVASHQSLDRLAPNRIAIADYAP